MRKCVVSFADSTGDYQKKLRRLEQSLKGNFDGDFIGFTSYSEIGSPLHSEIPYAFKPHAIQKAIDMGYELILWADSPIYAKQSIEPVFDHIERWSYLFFDNIGYSLGDYTNDVTLEWFSLTREQSYNIKMIMACVMGFNTAKVSRLIESYGNLTWLYPGSWDNHRHDQSVISALINQANLDIIKGQDTFFAYESHKNVMPIADSVCLFSG